jgi:hypothetical protein
MLSRRLPFASPWGLRLLTFGTFWERKRAATSVSLSFCQCSMSSVFRPRDSRGVTHCSKRTSIRYDTLLRDLRHITLTLALALHYTTSIQQQSCSRAASSVAPYHRRISSSSTVLHASPPCIVPRLVRGSIGSSGSTNKSASFSTWGMETSRFGPNTMRLFLLL